MSFYEDYLSGRFSSNQTLQFPQKTQAKLHKPGQVMQSPMVPPKSIQMMGHRLFVVQYEPDLLHAIDGLSGRESINLVAVPLVSQTLTQTQIIVRVYRGDESYLSVLKALQCLYKKLM